MKTCMVLIKRNVKLFFKDKGMFFTSLITPAILLILYATFLADVYRDGVLSSLPETVTLPERVLNGLVGGQLTSSILAVSCVTVTFCSNFLMVQDKVTGAVKDLLVSPVKASALSLGYFFANLISSLTVCFVATGVCLIYVAIIGWYMSAADVVLLFVDVILVVLFGSALSSVINFFLSTQGQISAVGTVISSCYGFICGAYMPISSFGTGLQTALSFLPGTYATSIIRTHSLCGVLDEMQKIGIPRQAVETIKNSLDCNVVFFENKVELSIAYVVVAATVAVLLVAYVLLNLLKKKKA